MPITDEAGQALGVLALRGVPPDSLSHALVHDLGLIARWCAKTNASRGLAIDETTSASGEPDRPAPTPPPAPPEADDSPPSGSHDSIERESLMSLEAGGRHTARLAPPAPAGHRPGRIGAGRAGPLPRAASSWIAPLRFTCWPSRRMAGPTGQPQSAGAHGGADPDAACPGRARRDGRGLHAKAGRSWRGSRARGAGDATRNGGRRRRLVDGLSASSR